MSTGTGVPKVGAVGRSSLDDRILSRSRYHNLGVVMGCAVGVSASGMSYTVSTGTDPVSVAVGSRGGADGAVEFPVPAVSVSTTAAPASGGRIDTVWARQLNPDNGDSDNQVVVSVSQGNPSSGSPVAPILPPGAVELAQYLVPQGATRTNQATLMRTGARAVPYGSSLGVLHSFLDTMNGKPANQGTRTLGGGSINLPMARRLEFRIQPTVAAVTNSQSGTVWVRFMLDGAAVAGFEIEFNRFWKTQFQSRFVVVPAGVHTVAYQIEHQYGDPYVLRYGGTGNPAAGTAFEVIDAGIA